MVGMLDHEGFHPWQNIVLYLPRREFERLAIRTKFEPRPRVLWSGEFRLGVAIEPRVHAIREPMTYPSGRSQYDIGFFSRIARTFFRIVYTGNATFPVDLEALVGPEAVLERRDIHQLVDITCPPQRADEVCGLLRSIVGGRDELVPMLGVGPAHGITEVSPPRRILAEE